MERLRGRKPSPEMVVSIIAPVFALAGSAAAGVATISVLSKKEKKQTRNIARDEIKKAAPGLSVARAGNADTATQAQNATNAVNATNAASGQPAAFAHVSGAGVLDQVNAKNVGSVTRVSEGVYCFSGIPFTPRGAQATVDLIGAMDEYAQLGIGPECAPPDQEALVETLISSGALSDAPFYVVFYR